MSAPASATVNVIGVADVCRISVESALTLIQRRAFPRPVCLATRMFRWDRAEVEAFAVAHGFTGLELVELAPALALPVEVLLEASRRRDFPRTAHPLRFDLVAVREWIAGIAPELRIADTFPPAA